MDRNAFLAFALSFAVLTLWMVFTTPGPRPSDGAPRGAKSAATEGAVPESTSSATAPPAVDLDAEADRPREGAAVPEASAEDVEKGERIPVDTPLFLAELDTRGGVLRRFELKGYRVAPAEGTPPLVLTTGAPPYANALATPFRELGLGDLSRVEFAPSAPDAHTVSFRWEREGVLVEKVYRFEPDSYAFELRLSVQNGSQRSIGPRYGLSWPAHAVADQDFREQAFTVLHQGGLVREPVDSFGSPGFFGGRPDTQRVFGREVDWAGIGTTYFVSAMLPDDPLRASAQFVATDPGRAGVVQIFFDPLNLPPGQRAERVFRVYVGPKVAERLEAVGGGLVRSIDLGWSWLAPLTLAFSWLLRALHSLIPNYGVGIILLTILVRAVTTPLTMKQMRSMERMRALQPKLQELRERFPDDRQKQSEEMMKLYRREGVNPLGGCLPMLLQLPVFIGLFYALRSSIDLRQAPFVGWIDDLSAPDTLFVIPGLRIPFRVLPIVMGATMVLQQKITPMQVDPAQARMMMIVMPVMMTVLFYQFPSGLVLYWMVSNVLAIAHQLWVGRGLRSRP